MVAKKEAISKQLEVSTKKRQETFGEMPNSFTELAKTFGVSEDMATNNPLEFIMTDFEEVRSGAKDKGQFLNKLIKNGAPRNITSAADDVLRVMDELPTKHDRNKNIIITGSLIVALGAFAMAWNAGKSDQQGAHG